VPDDLFTPTIAPAAYEDRRPPWRPQSMLYPALLGGATAVAVLALINAYRLRLPRKATLALVGAWLAALAGRLVATLVLADGQVGRPARLLGALAGALVWLVVSATQKGRFRAFELRGGDAASLWGPGVAAVLLLGASEGLLIALLVDP
jgi:hypothetical protein